MRSAFPTVRQVVALMALAVVAMPAGAIVRGTTDSGRDFVSGGVGSEEMEAINRERTRYGLAVLTAAKGSGAFLSDIHVRITDAHESQVLDTVMDGPWLLVDLPAGRYTITATLNGQVQKTSLSLGNNGHHQATFYFDTHDEIEPTGTEHTVTEGSR
jgi:hypothetical protein